MAPTVSCLSKTVRYEPSLKEEDLSKPECSIPQNLLTRHGLLRFATFLPTVLLDKPVRQFYDTLKKNSVTNHYTAQVCIYTSPDFQDSEILEIDVTATVRSLFNLSHRGMFPHTMDEKTASELTQPAALEGQHTYGTAHNVNLQPSYKVLTKFIHACWFGYTGSNDQISLVQTFLLTVLMQDEDFNWEAAYMKVLMDEQSHPKKLNYLRQGTHISGIILEATRDLPVFWKKTKEITTDLLVSLGPLMKASSKKGRR